MFDSLRSTRRPVARFALAFIALMVASWTEAKVCIEGTPAIPVPTDLWGTLRPADVGSVPPERDTTNYTGAQQPSDRTGFPLFSAIDAENGWLFTTYTFGMKIWDANGANAANPVLTATQDGPAGFLEWLTGNQEQRELLWDVDAPEGVDTVVATVGIDPVGFDVWDTTNKANPRQPYQDTRHSMKSVWATTINGRHYAFAGAQATTGGGGSTGVHIYDMTAALALLPGSCIQHTAQECPGIRIGGLGIQPPAEPAVLYVDGLKKASNGKVFVVFSSGVSTRGFEIWDVSNPASPVDLGGGRLLNGLSDPFVFGVALWEQGSKQFLGMQVRGTFNGARIYDVTDCLNGSGCSSLPKVWEKSFNVSASQYFTTYSKSAGRSYIYLGNEDKCSGGLQREWLFDVTALGSGGQPVDLTPSDSTGKTLRKSFPNELGQPVEVDYWSYYYATNPSGFSQVMPRVGKVHGSYFYRTAWTLFDVHQLTAGLPPTANFDWSPNEIYPGTPVTFSDFSLGTVTSRAWTFADGSPPVSTVAPQTVSFGSPGEKLVTLAVNNSVGGDTLSLSVAVLDPAPVAGTVTDTPDPVLVCQNATFTASGFKGKPPLTYSWEVVDASDVVVDSGSGVDLKTFVWDNTTGQTPGAYTGNVTVSNTSGSAKASASIQLTALPALAFLADPPTCTNCSGGPPPAPVAGTATFSVSAQGATQWDWDFDGDGQYDFSTTDPAVGPNPSKSYASTGNKTVRVRISNCQNPGGVVSAPLTINIAQLQPLVASFAAQGCNFNPCGFSVGSPITFTDETTGTDSSSQWFYDWTNTGAGEAGCSFPAVGLSSPSATHTFTATGTVRPCVKVTRGSGSESDVFVHAIALTISNSAPPPPPPPPPTKGITINGPTSGQVNQSLSFTATTTNCTASPTGWKWTANGGGDVSDGTSSVSITWPSTGNKSVTVTNTGCSGVTGTKTVAISDPASGGLSANFTFDPANPQIGQTVTFNAGSSTGAPATYSWTFGDGETTTQTVATVTHTFKSAGVFQVKLDVGKPGSSCPFGFCTSSITKPVTVSGNPPPVASFTTDAECVTDLSGTRCNTEVGKTVTFASTSAGATSHAWTFGDGGSASGAQVTHAWTAPGTFQVSLTAGNANGTGSTTRLFVVTGKPEPKTKTVVLPWTAQTRGALVQSSDLYVHNPSSEAVEVTLQFRKRGAPETDPPTVKRLLQPSSTLFVGDALRDLFQRENVVGLITVSVEDAVEPIITSFNTTFQPDGSEFGQTIPGVSMTKLGAAARASETQVQQLVGLNDNTERIAYFGVSNPNDAPASFRLRFFDPQGQQIGPVSQEFTISRFGQRQFQLKEIRELFGVSGISDYRVEVETTDGGAVVPFASNLRLVSEDPSFIIATPSLGGKTYLIGALSQPGLNDSTWVSDVVLSNPDATDLSASLTFTKVGFNSEPTSPVVIDLEPGQTRRLANVIGTSWGITDSVGVVTIQPLSSQDGPVVQGESYDNTNPQRRFGQTMNAFTDADAAGQGTSHYLVGLRQDAHYRTTYWLFNPGDTPAEYDILYLALDGSEIDRLSAVGLGAGKARQLSPGQHPLPAEGVPGGFTLRILVKSGKVLAGAQVINNLTNDPAYIRGDTR